MMEPTVASLLPPLVAILLAVLLRQVLVPLATGVFCGAMLLAFSGIDGTDASFAANVGDGLKRFVVALYESGKNFDHLMVLAFSLLLGAMVGVLEHGGGMAALLSRFAHKIRSRRAAQALISMSGLAIFFDDYANTLLIGGTYRSLADRFAISRAKLAYLVDSTAAPVAGLALVSTWVATEISYLQEGLAAAESPAADRAFELFIRSLPYRFYPWLAILMVMTVSLSQRDFGPMRAAEVIARKKSDVKPDSDQADSGSMGRILAAAVLPLLVCVASVLVTLVITGLPQSSTDANDVVEGSWTSGGSWTSLLGQAIRDGNSYTALVVGGAGGMAAAFLGALVLRQRDAATIGLGAVRGSLQMMPAMIVLWLAWALSSMTDADALNTGGYLAGLLNDSLDPRWLPTSVFVLAGVVAFSTGTSWGTMAILTPIAVTLALKLDPLGADGTGGPDGAIHLATFGSVLAGAIFGDHCSPISDTTVLSSRSCGCDHILHVQTQLPYAVTVAVICVVTGTLPVALGVSPWVCLFLGTAMVLATVRMLGRDSVAESAKPHSS